MGVFKSHVKHFAFWELETHHDAKLKDYKLYTHKHTENSTNTQSDKYCQQISAGY